MIRVLIVDDSIVARTIFTRMLESRPQFRIVAAVPDAVQALRIIASERVDVVLLDLEMPGMGGLELLPQIIAQSAGARVLIVSSAAADGAAATLEALALGAADTLQKPGPANFLGRFADTLAERLVRIAGERPQARPRHEHLLAPLAQPAEAITCIAIGASTGGLHALNEMLPLLGASFTAPILITQHLPAGFMPYFARQTATMAGRATSVARDGDTLEPGRIWVAPGEGHLRLVREGNAVRIRIDGAPAPSGCMPSVDPMFQTLAEVYGKGGVAVVLSGMGRDGTIGARALAAVGAEILVQDPETSVVWGMPGSIAEARLASAVLAPAQIAGRILDRAGLAR